MKKIIKILNNKKGFTLVECVVSIAIFAIISMLIFQCFSTANTNILKSNQRDEARSDAVVTIATEAKDTSIDNNKTDGNIAIKNDEGTTISKIDGKYYTYIDETTGETYTVFVPDKD